MICRPKLFGARLLTTLFGALSVIGAKSAFAENYPFSGFFAYGHSKEAMTTKFLELSCALRPIYTDKNGKLSYLTFDIDFFRSFGKLRYAVADGGWTSSFDPNSKTIIDVPTYKFDGNEYYAPKVTFRLVQAQDQNSIELITFRGVENFYKAVILKKFETGERGVFLRCPFAQQNYQKYTVRINTIPPISKESIDKTFRISEGIDEDDQLFERVKKLLEK